MLTITEKLKLCWRILRKDDSALLRHAQDELARLAQDDEPDDIFPEGPQTAMNRDLMELFTVFATQGAQWVQCRLCRISVQALGKLRAVDPAHGGR